jgi:hypothetical protein
MNEDMTDSQIRHSRIFDNETYTCTFCDNEIEADNLCEHDAHTFCRDCCKDNEESNPRYDRNDLD